MSGELPSAILGQKYISLTTFRKNGVAVATPVWFGEEANKLYVMTRSDMGKTKRIRNNPQVRVAPCTRQSNRSGVSGDGANSSSHRACSRSTSDQPKILGCQASLDLVEN